MGSLLWLLYQAAVAFALLAAGPFLLARRGRHYLPALAARLGREPDAGGEREGGEWERQGGECGLWIHAVSVGEVGVAAILAAALPADLPLLVTTVTPTGQARARAAFAGRARVAYLPFDLGPLVGRFLRRFAPRALVLIEGDYWPLLLRQAHRRGLPVAVVNGRIGDRTFRRLRFWRPIAGILFSRVDSFALQSEQDRDRLLALGVPARRLAVTGNLKFEAAEPAARPELMDAVTRLAAGRPVLLAGSTMEGEEPLVLDAFVSLGGGERALLVLGPRHPERWDEVDGLLRQRGLPHLRRSRLALPASSPAAAPPPGVLLLDSLGELAGLYRLAAAAFIGGTLVPTGGHNPLEAARYAVPVAAGPSMHNFRDMAERFDRAAAWRRVADAQELAGAWAEWLADPAGAREQGRRAQRLVEENRGALARTLDLLSPFLFHAAGGAGGGRNPALDGSAATEAGSRSSP
ncbi:MAG TPA: 3-deoxy-D-manno-octulosonic acid transferase [Thermoanaerobaculia bacterium]|nr:3-deoxy-D-manno-octulosonic acid transferase [Thermoanaerobaculia bacterium]